VVCELLAGPSRSDPQFGGLFSSSMVCFTGRLQVRAAARGRTQVLLMGPKMLLARPTPAGSQRPSAESPSSRRLCNAQRGCGVEVGLQARQEEEAYAVARCAMLRA